MSETNRIAKNTIVVYARLFLTTIIGLLTSRFALQALGISDYGLYNVVGGVIAMFSVISGSLSTTTVRFLNMEIGKENGKPNEIFNICNVVHIVFAIILLLLAETLGVYYILHYLNVEPGKEASAMFVFQVSTIVACLGLINIPYVSTFIAKEKFIQIAIVDIVNAIIKLLSVILLLNYSGNTLKMYALLMSLTTFFSFLIYHYLSYKQWKEIVQWNFVKARAEYKKVLTFNNYNFLAAVSLVFRSQGTNILINMFFGTIINGAYAIAKTVQGFVEAFMANFDTAAAPQIVQHVAAGNNDASEQLVYKISRYCILMMILVLFPLYLEIDYLLHLWLGVVVDDAIIFCKLLLIVLLVASTAGGILQYINASGKIKWFKIQSCFWSLLIIPLGYWGFSAGCAAWWIFILLIGTDVFNRITQLVLMKKLLSFDSIAFIKSAYTRPIIVLLSMLLYSVVYVKIQTGIAFSGWGHMGGILLTIVANLFCILFVGITPEERENIKNKLTLIVQKNGCKD